MCYFNISTSYYDNNIHTNKVHYIWFLRNLQISTLLKNESQIHCMLFTVIRLRISVCKLMQSSVFKAVCVRVSISRYTDRLFIFAAVYKTTVRRLFTPAAVDNINAPAIMRQCQHDHGREHRFLHLLLESLLAFKGMDQGEELAKREYSPPGCPTGITTRWITGSASLKKGNSMAIRYIPNGTC